MISRKSPPFAPGSPLEICFITWNMEGTCGPENPIDLLKPIGHHLYCIGTEECERSIAASYVNQSKAKWEEKLSSTLGDEYKVVASHTLMAIHIILFARSDVVEFIKEVGTDHVATGLLNGTIGNKGGVYICCMVGNTSLLFVNSHFQAHQNKVAERNNDYRRISSGITKRVSKSATNKFKKSPLRSDEDGAKSPTSGAGGISTNPNQSADSADSETGGDDATDYFDVVFWAGDLNYRINGQRRMVDVLLKDQCYREVLLANDQLLLERKKGQVFPGFKEAEIEFRPTYKYQKTDGKATDYYDQSEKARIPAWTDRILYKTNPPYDESNVTVNLYTCIECESLRVSDHRPVVANITIQTDPIPMLSSSPLYDVPLKSGSTMCTIC